jgi:hypothetical protein
MSKSLFTLLFFTFFLGAIPSVVQAQTAQPLDARCFTQTECKAARAKMNMPIEEQVKGFYNNTSETREACKNKKDSAGIELGFCLPAGQAVTTVKFGGTTKFANIGIFIQYIYRYGIIFAGILAVLIIIVAGLQWTSSGGNSSTIESAKNRITGAVTGLILVACSYIILNTINPATVNLRLPQIWLLRQDRIQNQHEFCVSVPAVPTGERGKFTIPKIAPYSENYQSIPEDQFKEIYTLHAGDDRYQEVFPQKTENNPGATCGQKMVIQDTQGTSCTTTYCPDGQLCFAKEGKCKPGPERGGIAGTITARDGKYLDDIWLKVVCNDEDGNSTIRDIDSANLGDGVDSYQFSDVTAQGASECGEAKNIAGYFFTIEVNDSDLLNTTDDQWIGGRSFCQINGPSCGFYGYNGSLNDSDAEPFIGAMIQTQELFLPAEIDRGFKCDFTNTVEAMPNMGNAYSAYVFYAGVNYLLDTNSRPDNESAEFGTLNGKCRELSEKQDQWDAYIKKVKDAKNKK